MTERETLTFYSFFVLRDGYGYSANCIARALAPMGVRLEEMVHGQEELAWQTPGPALIMGLPDWWKFVHAKPLAGLTMHEATRLAPGWAETINQSADVCVVPCRWNAEVFQESGVTRPIGVAPFGIDPEQYYPLERRRPTGREPYTFAWSGNGGSDMRKGWDVAYRAFRKAFGDRKDVRLLLHFRQQIGGRSTFADENVETVTGFLDMPVWRGFLETADVFVFPSRGEGWGLPPREAAATGLPVLVTDFGGTAEEIEAWAMPIRVAGMSVARYGWYQPGEVGEWAEPDVDHLVELMRWCEQHREAASAKGAAAAAWMKEATWDRTARAIMEITESVGG